MASSEITEESTAELHFDNFETPIAPKPNGAIRIAVSSQTLFNMKKERQVYEEEGQDHEDQPLLPGVAFPFVKAIMTVNSHLRELYPDCKELFEIVLMTNNHPKDEGRLINSINQYGLTIEWFCQSGSGSTVGYLKAYMTDLYLSEDSEKVKEAIEERIAAATMLACDNMNKLSDKQLRIAFDGDAVLFSDESEIITKRQGLDAFIDNEKKLENKPLPQGPLKGFLEAVWKLQQKFYTKRLSCPIRTYLVTSRGATGGGVRALKTFKSWGLDVDEAMFLSGSPKGPLLQTIRPHIFFDDQMSHIEGARELGTIAAHVPYGIWSQPSELTT
ncbi:cytosolic 5'-nucleotidase 1A [Clupea harengus]|uniref:Cytosolic 5'-nucleotidase 1A n=1 Tax=Clupea harengus TaxID=7950 RepID=A0A6P8G936_CLUHA|nr:cytosolic 5'-nucleotidase 1A [Clupea harengus]